MSLVYWGKQPRESILKTLDVTDQLPTGETLDAAETDVTAYDAADVDVSADLLDDISISSPYVTMRLLPETVNPGPPPATLNAAGIYRLRFLMVTTTSEYVFEQDVELTIREE